MTIPDDDNMLNLEENV